MPRYKEKFLFFKAKLKSAALDNFFFLSRDEKETNWGHNRVEYFTNMSWFSWYKRACS